MKRTLFFLLTILFLISCKEDNEPMWFDSQYVFLEQHLSVYSELITGEGEVPHLCVDFPMYDYNSNTKELWGTLSSDITLKTQILLGMGESHSGIASSGAGTGLQEIHNLPHEGYNLTVKSIYEDGTVHFTYKDSLMTLSPDEEWSVIWTKSDTLTSNVEDWDNYIGFGDVETIVDTMIIMWTYHDRVTNWGLLEKEKFGNLEDLYN